MKIQRLIEIFCVALFTLLPIQAAAQNRCSVELILALDVSGSVDWKEYRLQRVGVASAFRDSEVTELISFLPGGIQVAITQWAGPQDQRIVLDWNSVHDEQSAFAFADKTEDITRYATGPMTAIGNALIHANRLLQRNPKPCFKSVIDISSDGHNNQGNEPSDVATILEAKGVTINALVVLGEDLSLLRYFETNVIRGHGAFVQPTYGYNDYARAIKEKLLRELSPSLSYRKSPSRLVRRITASKN